MSDKGTATNTTVKYVVTKDCVYNNVWHKKGEVLELPSSVKVNHAFIQKYSDENKPKVATGVYDSSSENMTKRRVEAVTMGVFHK